MRIYKPYRSAATVQTDLKLAIAMIRSSSRLRVTAPITLLIAIATRSKPFRQAATVLMTKQTVIVPMLC